MANFEKLKIMISSRCNDCFPEDSEVRLSEHRVAIQEELEKVELFGKKIFEVWINEKTPPKGGSWDSLDICLNAVKECDVLVILNNGNAGWEAKGSIGICHQEAMSAMSTCPGKIRALALKVSNPPDTEKDKRFRAYIETCNFFRGQEIITVDQLKATVREAVLDAFLSLAHSGVREAMKGRFHTGEALEWARLTFEARSFKMVTALESTLMEIPEAKKIGKLLTLNLAKTDTVFICHGIPGGMGVASAKEMVGQPFLKDHLIEFPAKEEVAGPFHLIACQKNATESQAIKLLGTPDATVVTTPFGVYVSDPLYKAQFAFLSNCRDDTTIRHNVARFFEWMKTSGEEEIMARRAVIRSKIIQAMRE